LRIGFVSAVLLTAAVGLGAGNGEDRPWPEPTSALIALDENELEVKSKTKARLRCRRSVIVYASEGRKYGNITLVKTDFVKPRHVEGAIKDLDGRILKRLDARSAEQTVLYNGTVVRTHRLSQNTFPYVVEYEYEVDLSSLFFWPDWRPQEDVPVLRSTYRLTVPKDIGYSTHAMGLDVTPKREGKSTLVWELENIEPRVEELHMSPDDQVQKALLFAPERFRLGEYEGSFASWEAVATWYRELAADRYELPEEAREQVQRLIAGAADQRQSVARLYAFLQDHTRYVAIMLGIGGWQPSSAESTFDNRYGDCKDLSTLMVAMLAEAGIEAYPALVRTNSKGRVQAAFPSNQFNHCMVLVPLQGDSLWLECTTDLVPAGELPAGVEAADALVIDDGVGVIRKIPRHAHDRNVWRARVAGELKASGQLTFSGKASATGNIDTYIRGKLQNRSPEDREHWMAEFLGRFLPKLDLGTHRVDFLEGPGDSLSIQYQGELDNFGVRTAGRLFVNPNMFRRKTSDDIPRESKRRYPVHYPYGFVEMDSVSVRLPEGFQLEAAPDSVVLISSFATYQTGYTIADGQFHHSRNLQWVAPDIPLSEYEAYLDFLREVVRIDNSSFVFRKARRW
jgi:hypothetical protein